MNVSERSSTAIMSSLRLQKRLAAGVMKCGKNKVSSILSSPPRLPDFAPTGVVGPQRDQRDCQRQLLPEHPQAHQGWSRNQEACRCPLQVQLDPLILQFRPPLVLLKLTCVHCVGPACCKNDEARSKGRHTGFGKRKGTKDVKTSQKTMWILRSRSSGGHSRDTGTLN